MSETKCSVDGCGEEARAGGMCSRHYMQKRRGRLGKTRRITEPGQASTMNFAIDKDTKIALRVVARRHKISASELVRRTVESAVQGTVDAVRAKRDSRKTSK